MTTIPESELMFRYFRSGGPGGQNVNKVSTAVELRFDARGSLALADGVRARLMTLAGSRLTSDGVIVITAVRFRSQERNREDAVARLQALVDKAAVPPTPRVRTRPTRASKERRLQAKSLRSGVKSMRGRPTPD